MRTQVFVKSGDVVKQELPYSEVCMHMGIAGKIMDCRLESNGMVQILSENGGPYSFPIATGEAGFYNSGDERGWYTYDLEN